MELKKEYACTFIEHDNNACKARKELDSLPYRPKAFDLYRIAQKYKTTLRDMKEHETCLGRSTTSEFWYYPKNA